MKDYLELNEQERKALEEQFLRDPDFFYKKAETDRLKEALNRTYKERFLVMTRLMKLNALLSKARIITQSSTSNPKD